MTYAYYHNMIKGKSPKNNSTYIAEQFARGAKGLSRGNHENS